ncbi:sensor histidine kinase [Enemella sp. A6]|uniref:sensor histidine kinase n=1 Tax=Enemella sp. A6 TaxID=3440152 RepID=UPI003EBEB20E
MWVVLAAVAGLVVGCLVGYLVLRAQQRPTPEPPPPPPTELPPIVPQIINVLRTAGVVVGPHDEVLQSSAQARTLGIVRGSRVIQPELLKLVREVRAEGQLRTLDQELPRDTYSKMHLSSRVAPLGDGLVLVLSEDRTAAKRVDDTRRDFVANVSHELKTPIGAVALLSEAIAEAAEDPEAVRRFAGRLGNESNRLAELVRQIIDLSRLQSQDPLQKMDVVEIDQVLANAVDRCRVDADRRKITLTITPDTGLQVLGDSTQLTGAVVNLVENAIVYSDDGAKVVASSRRVVEDDEFFVEISVSDNGIGIAPAETERIFERFYRVDYSRSRANGGTGLGLSIVKHIAGAHGGTVSVWSQLGHGSTFTIRVPEHIGRDDMDKTGYDQP